MAFDDFFTARPPHAIAFDLGLAVDSFEYAKDPLAFFESQPIALSLMVISVIVDFLRMHGLIVITPEQSAREHHKIYRRKTSGKCRRIWS